MHRMGGGRGKLNKEFECSVNTGALVIDGWLRRWIIYCGWSLDIIFLCC